MIATTSRVLVIALAASALALVGCALPNAISDAGTATTPDTGGADDIGFIPQDAGHTKPCTSSKDCDGDDECRGHLCVPAITDGGTTTDSGPTDGGQALPDGGTSDGGCAAMIEVSPAAIEFGQVTAGCNSKDVTITLQNTGCADLLVAAVNILQSSTSMMIMSCPVTPFSMAPSTELDLMLRYHPAATIGAESGTLTFETFDGAVTEVPLHGSAVQTSEVHDTFTVDPLSRADVLWCIDTSPRMGTFQKLVADNFYMIGTHRLYPPQVDVQMGIITSEVEGTSQLTSGDATTSGVLFNRAGAPRVIANAPQVPHAPALDPVSTTEAEFVSAFQNNVQAGESIVQKRKGCLEAIKMALSEPNVSDPQKNGGFLREGKPLNIAIISNVDDNSPASVTTYADFLQTLGRDVVKAPIQVTVIGGFSGDGVIDQLLPKDCEQGNGPVKAATRYLAFLRRVEHGSAYTLCRDDWANLLWTLGGRDQGGFMIPNEFYLTRYPDPASISVLVNGNVVLADPVKGWTYDDRANSIIFGTAAVPRYGSTIEVTYHAACF